LNRTKKTNPVGWFFIASLGSSETVAAHRFFDNGSVDWRDWMAPHWQQTQQRMAARPVMLCLEDTTELDFNGQETKGWDR
jgi:hypothetical protein